MQLIGASNSGVAARSRELGLAALLAAVWIGVSLASRDFATWRNFSDLLIGLAPLAIVACGLAFVMLAGEIDLSVGSLYGLLAVVMGRLVAVDGPQLSTAGTIAIILPLGALLGLCNGLLVTLGRIPSIVATLAMLGVLRGAADWLLGGVWITKLPAELRQAATGTFAGVPLPILIAIVVLLPALAASRNSPLGLSLRAIGSNPAAARLSGISGTGARLAAFSLCGLLTALAMLISVPQLSVIESGVGAGLELTAITCVVVGGTAATGGRGTVAGVLLAVLLIGSLRSALIFLKLGESATYWERTIQGAFILGAVLLDRSRFAVSAVVADATDSAGGFRFGRSEWVALALLVALLVGAGITDSSFTTPATQFELANHAWELAIVAIPLALVIISGGIDLSIGATMALSSVVFGLVFEAGANVWVAASAGLAAAALAGLVNGLFITRLDAPPLIVTLATLAAYRGIAEGISAARPISGFPPEFLALARPTLLGAPVSVFLVTATALGAVFLLGFTATGRRIRALGLSESAARFSAIRIERLRLGLYTASGVAAGVAAILFAARRSTAKADVGVGLELEAITALVLGGISLRGGRGAIVGALLGVALVHELREFVGWRWARDELSAVAIGVILILGALASAWRQTQRRPLAVSA